jgi:hypothetical protein
VFHALNGKMYNLMMWKLKCLISYNVSNILLPETHREQEEQYQETIHPNLDLRQTAWLNHLIQLSARRARPDPIFKTKMMYSCVLLPGRMIDNKVMKSARSILLSQSMCFDRFYFLVCLSE